MSNARKFTLLSIAAVALAAMIGVSPPAQARTNVDVDLFFRTGSPSHGGAIYVDFDSRPEFVRIPSSRVRYVRGSDCDVYYYSGWYYAYDDGYWFRSRDWDGPWFTVRYSYVPRQVIYVPERYRPRWVYVRGDYSHPYRSHDNGRHRGWYKHDGRRDNDRNDGWRDPRFEHGRRQSDRNDRDRDYRDRDNRDRDRDRDWRDDHN